MLSNRRSSKTQSHGLPLSTSLRLAWSSFRNRRLSEKDTYLFDHLGRGDFAIDCGANVGTITELMAARHATVHAFEPDPNAFEVLSKRFAVNPDVKLYNKAVSDHEGQMKLFFRQEHVQDPVKFSVGSTLNPSKNDVNTSTFALVNVISLSDFLTQFDRIRILKLDIEGAECEVLEDLIHKNLFDRIDLTLVETHEEWVPDLLPRLNKIRESLRNRGIKSVHLNWI